MDQRSFELARVVVRLRERNGEVPAAEARVGAHIQYSRVAKHDIFFRRISELANHEKKRMFTARAGYRYGFPGRPNAGPYEHGGIAEAVARWWFPWSLLASGRTR
jgi:hypothetical protein